MNRLAKLMLVFVVAIGVAMFATPVTRSDCGRPIDEYCGGGKQTVGCECDGWTACTPLINSIWGKSVSPPTPPVWNWVRE